MPRLGQNPMKWTGQVHQPQKITVTTVVHIPMLEGYWQESLEVLKLCLQSMRSSTRIPFDLMVFDNGSCETVVNYLVDLQKSGFIQYLLLSDKNLGKVGAWNVLFQAAQGDIVSFCDSDVLFLDGWLDASLKILDHFPKAGIVTAMPIAGGDHTTLQTARLANQDPDVITSTGIFVPDEYIRACVLGLGYGEDEFELRKFNRKDVLLNKDGVEAYTTASHFQFTAKKSLLSQLFPANSDLALGGDVQFEDEMVNKGYWRLSTKEYLIHHMGNHIPNFREEIPWYDTSSLAVNYKTSQNSDPSWVLSNKIIRNILKKINIITYDLLYGKK